MFYKSLEDRCTNIDSCLCVGLDIDWREMSAWFPAESLSLLEFSKRLIETTSPYASVFKFNHAFYAANGLEDDLSMIIRYTKEKYPEIPIILDSKRGDIGNSAQRYAEEAFVRFGADAVTVNPFLGWESVEPFLSYPNKGVVLLCRTSNEGSEWIQEFGEERPVYLRIAERVNRECNPNLLLVIGATQTEALSRVRQIAPSTTFLIPGVGVQGGDLAEALRRARRSDGIGAIVNCSRSIVAQGKVKDYFDRVARAAEHYAQAMSIR